MDIEKIVESQRKFFNSRQTYDVNFRLEQLKKLRKSIKENYQLLIDAFIKDLNKSEHDVYMTEISLVVSELKYFIKHLKSLAKPKKVKTSITNLGSYGQIVPEPYGVNLIVAPWNYPFQLSIIPVIGAIAAGNTVILKPSSATANISDVIKKILSVFSENYISVIIGSREETEKLFDQKFDFAFFTGGTKTAKVLLEKLSKNLTPAVLELGGKSPCIVDYDADIEKAVKKCVWGKFTNAGQTCVAPDYFLVHETIKEKFIEKCKSEILKRYYVDGELSPNFVHIVNERQVEKIKNMIDYDKVVFGGKINGKVIEPTIMDNVNFEDKIMQEEIFGPVMPIITFNSLENVIDDLQTKEKPLALYYFSENKSKQELLYKNVIYGGGCINDTLVHVTEENLPFGGIGNSGMGSYHGEKTFETFSHYKSVLINNKNFDFSIKYMPYNNKKTKLVKWIYKL